ncbi:MAG: lipid-A-disaccharide synthase [Alphaproteobacteria bacterium]|nr:lipid-A-disaccharide synthase [Alphaproteobacteria bacterium]
MTKKIFIIAGEDSGDILASGLMKRINTKADVQYFGIGGDLMKAEGLEKSFFSMDELSVMGLDIVPQIPHFLRRINETVEEILRVNPDVVVTVDAPEFSFRVLKKLRAKNKYIKLVHYVSPSVWAWREKRAEKISKFLNAVLLLWPFEKKYYPDIKTFYVGHPATMRFKELKEIKTNKILCLPGSRKKEVSKLLPVFTKVINKLYEKDKTISVAIPVAPNVAELVEKLSQKINAKVTLIHDDDKKKKLNGKIAMVASGTAVFEIALKEIPTVSAYKMGRVAGLIGKIMIKSKWVTLPNIIMNKQIVPELLQRKCNEKAIREELEKLLYNDKEILKQRNNFKKMKNKLKVGRVNPDIEAAKAIMKFL